MEKVEKVDCLPKDTGKCKISQYFQCFFHQFRDNDEQNKFKINKLFSVNVFF